MGIVCSRSSLAASNARDRLPHSSSSNSMKQQQRQQQPDNSTNSSSEDDDPVVETTTTPPVSSRTRAYSNYYTHVSASVAEQLEQRHTSANNNNKKQRKSSSNNNNTTTTTIGMVGLSNLGNTCFMNSSLQCLAATIPLTDYCLAHTTTNANTNNNSKNTTSMLMELNTTNPLGTGGRLATRYAELMQSMWYDVLRVYLSVYLSLGR